MTKVAYWDCPTGIAGDMCLGALLSAGVPLAYLEEILTALGLHHHIHLDVQEVLRQGQSATYLQVNITPPHPHCHRHLREISEIIGAAPLPPEVKHQSLAVFEALAEAEGKVHGLPPDQVHFHEVGALDAILDIVGTCAGLHWLGVEQVFASRLPKGGGTVLCDHGRLPVPTPAVLQLWQKYQVPVWDNGIEKELVTPTGAALLVGLCEKIGVFPAMTIDRVGLGAGTQELPMANVVRLCLGETLPDCSRESIVVLETQVDDLSPQVIAYVMEEMHTHGARDAYTQPVYMKKGRMGTLITVLCAPETSPLLESILFRETSTLGIRRRIQERIILGREMTTRSTPWGPVGAKIAHRPDRDTVQPEYEDCAKLAREHQVPLQVIQGAVP